MPRLPDLDPDTLPAEARRVHDAILSGPRGIVQGPLKVWLTSPGLADKAQALGAFCRYGTSLPARLSELAIIVTGAHWRAGFEWAVHAPLALAAGLPAAAVEAIRTGAEPVLGGDDERAVYRVATSLLRRRRLDDECYRFALRTLGAVALVELVGILGYYGLISMTINAFEVPLPEGVPEPFVDDPPGDATSAAGTGPRDDAYGPGEGPGDIPASSAASASAP